MNNLISGSFARPRWPVADTIIKEPDTHPSNIPEAAIQDIWERQLLGKGPLFTTGGLSVNVEQPGTLNTGFGPDFLDARVSIDKTMWCGAVEIHRSSSDWRKHQHHTDSNYDTVVLHVTLIQDDSTGRLTRSDGTVIPELVLYPLLTTSLRGLLYEYYLKNNQGLPCTYSWQQLDDSEKTAIFERFGRLRIRQRAQRFAGSSDLEQALYEHAFRALGYRPNADAMQAVARRLPINKARGYQRNGILLEEMLCLSGLDKTDGTTTYPTSDTASANDSGVLLWTTSSVRPANHPRIRIAQGAALFSAHNLLAGNTIPKLLDVASSENSRLGLRRLVRPPLEESDSPPIGIQRADTVVIDAILPFLLFLAVSRDNPGLESTVWQCYRDIPPLSDAISGTFVALGARASNALESQGMHHLFRSRCAQSRCLDCPITTRLPGRR